MRRLLRWLLWTALTGLAVIVLLLAPVARNELFCTGPTVPDDYTPLLAEADRRSEARTLMTYPEWHIVHAYDDYARVIRDGDPHDFAFTRAITGYWSSLCSLTKAAANHGGVDGSTKQLVYVIGTSFTVELALKAAYEETLGRLATWLRGDTRAPLDDLSARQAADYATFLQQTPWYEWDFTASQDALITAQTGVFRDRERRFALGLENRAKASYARAIATAVAATGPDDLTLRLIASDITPGSYPDATVISERPEGLELETPRYRDLTRILDRLARNGGNLVEIAGNDDILFTATSPYAAAYGALYSVKRQGYGDYRHLILVKVTDLADTLRGLPARGLRLEHIHDY